MAKAVNPSQGKTIGELDEETRQQEESKHRQKHDDLYDLMAKQRIRAARLEKLNPITDPYPLLTPEELELIEKNHPDFDLTDEQIESFRANAKEQEVVVQLANGRFQSFSKLQPHIKVEADTMDDAKKNLQKKVKEEKEKANGQKQ